MKRYWSVMSEKGVQDLRKVIPDGSSKQAAVNKARQWMKDNGIKRAMLAINSMRTDNLLDAIDIELD